MGLIQDVLKKVKESKKKKKQKKLEEEDIEINPETDISEKLLDQEWKRAWR